MTGTAELLARHPVAELVDGPMRFQTIDKPRDFRALAAEWRALYRACGSTASPFQSFSFLDRWIEIYLPSDSRIAVVIARQAGKLVFALPLILRERLGVIHLEFMGMPVAQYCDALIDPAVASAVSIDLDHLVRSLGADILIVSHVTENSALKRLGLNSAHVVKQEWAPRADLCERVSGDQPGSAYSAKARSNYRRWLRHIEKEGPPLASFEPHGSDAVDAATLAIKLKRAWLEQNAIVSPTVFSPRFEAFFASMAAVPDDGGLKITALQAGDRTIGLDLSFDSEKCTFGHVLALATGASNGAGHLLIHAAFAAARRRGKTFFDLNAPADPFKLQHSDSVSAVTTYAFTPTIRGRLYRRMMLEGAMPLAKQIVRNLPRSASGALIRRLSR